MPKALNRVRSHHTYCLDLKTYNNFTTVRQAQILQLERKITGDEQNPLVVLPSSICSDCFIVGRLEAQEQPTLASCSLSDMRGNGTQNKVLPE